MTCLLTIQYILIGILIIYWAYQAVISILSLRKFEEKKKLYDKKHSFMIIIPAHNEENVIENLILSIKNQHYPKELFDIYVIADNCNDATADIAKRLGATVMHRNDPVNKTKGFAIRWFISRIISKEVKYDAFCVFDADNIVEKDFLNNINDKLCRGFNIVQGYRDIKNPTDSWVSSGYAIFYWIMNRFYHFARYTIGFSPLINGTGFVVKFDRIIPDGWNTISLTEDIEFSLINISAGEKIGWARDAVIYDEQPVDFSTSWYQRERWTVGHLQCLKNYFFELIKGTSKYKKLYVFDGLLYIIGIPLLLISLIIFVINIVIYMQGEMIYNDFFINNASFFFSTFIAPILIGIFTMILDRRKLLPMTKGLILYPLFMGSWILIIIKSLIKPNTKWKKVEHVNKLKIEDLVGNE